MAEKNYIRSVQGLGIRCQPELLEGEEGDSEGSYVTVKRLF